MYLNRSIKSYLEALSSEQPVPGGGGTSALVAALGISLAIMVARIASKRLDKRNLKKLNGTIRLLKGLQRNAAQTVDLDPKVYQEVISSYRQLRRSRDRKKSERRVEMALTNAFRLQADLAMQILMAKQLLGSIGAVSRGSIRNDLVVSNGLLDGAFQGACATARINAVYMKSAKQKRYFEQALVKLEDKYRKIAPLLSSPRGGGVKG